MTSVARGVAPDVRHREQGALAGKKPRRRAGDLAAAACHERHPAVQHSHRPHPPFAASIAQANYSAAKGGIVSLVRSAAAGMNKYGVTANCIAPVAKSRMSGNVPFGLEMGEPEDVAPMVCYLLSDLASQITGQVYTVNAGRIAVWNQPIEVREMRKDGRWEVEEIASRISEVGQEPMPILERLAAMEAEG